MEIDLTSLFLSFAISGIGFVLFSYGKKMTRAPQMVIGLILMVYPFFISELWLLGLIAGLCLLFLWLCLRLGW